MATPTEIIAALKTQVGHYERLAKLAAAQHAFVQQQRTEELLQTLGRRQIELDQIMLLEQTIAPVKKQWPLFLATLPAGDRDQAEQLMGSARALLEQITAADQNDALVLQQRKLNLGKQIAKASFARQVNKNIAAAAYGARPSKLNVST